MEYIRSAEGPAPIGPYSQAVRSGNHIFCSGMIALDPQDGEIRGADAQTQAVRALQNLQAVLKAGGAELAHVVKTTIYLVDMGDFAAVNDVYAEFFGRSKPARSTVAVAALPKGALVEIDAIAAL